MPNQSKDWRVELSNWLKNHPKTITADLLALREEFVHRFPVNKLCDMTLEQYALGHDKYKDSFCYWLEFKTTKLGSIQGGNVWKFGVWWDGEKGKWSWNKFFDAKTAKQALAPITEGLDKLVRAASEHRFDELDQIGDEYLGENRNGLRVKPLSLYFPDYFLPIFQPEHIASFLEVFGQQPKGKIVARNRLLLAVMQSLPEFKDFDTQQMMRFLYDCFDPKHGVEDPFEKTVAEFAKYAATPDYRKEERDYKEALIQRLGTVFAESTVKGGQFRDELMQAIKANTPAIDNLTHFTSRDDLQKYLGNATENQVSEQFAQLLYGKDELSSRIDTFEERINAGYRKLGMSKRIQLGMIALFLAAALPDECIFYRASLIDDACKAWAWEKPSGTTKGQSYVSYVEWAAPIRERLSQAIKQSADMVDVHSLLWFNHRQKGSIGKKEEEEESPEMPLEIVPGMQTLQHTRNVILYGPPGTGKTWIANHLTNYFLLHHNVSPSKAVAYWQAVGDRNTAEMLALSVEVRTQEDGSRSEPNFWWMTANPKIWDWDDLFVKREQFFKKGRLEKNFDAIQSGDIVFGYSATPTKQIVALARVKDELATVEENRQSVEGIRIEPFTKLSQPLTWQVLLSNPLLQESEPVKNHARGTLFRLTLDESQELIRLLKENGNSISLPEMKQHSYAKTVTFHQSFAYEEFIEGLKPINGDGGQVTYQVVDGAFREICRRAEAAWRTRGENAPKYVLLIDEINRANIAKVFGELIALIEDDKRLGNHNQLELTLPYSQDTFGVPPNLYIIGTMNTADRSIALLDIALRRRFAFIELMPRPELLRPIAGLDLGKLLTQINQRIIALLDRDHQVGHSYLIEVKDAQDLGFAWYHRIVPLLQEYFYNDGGRLRAVIGDAFVQAVQPSIEAKKALGDLFDGETPRYEIQQLQGDAFLNGLQKIIQGQ